MQTEIELLFDQNPSTHTESHFALCQRFKNELNAGQLRAPEPDASARTGWRANAWVKKGILLGFRMGGVVDMSVDPVRQPFLDKATYPVKRLTPESGVRIVPGGSSIRDGVYLGNNVTCMPPMFINVGAGVAHGPLIVS